MILLKDFCKKYNVPCPKELEDYTIETKWLNSEYLGEKEGVPTWKLKDDIYDSYMIFRLLGGDDYEYLSFKNGEFEPFYRQSVIGDYIIQT